jgi:hypothetical protein
MNISFEPRDSLRGSARKQAQGRKFRALMHSAGRTVPALRQNRPKAFCCFGFRRPIKGRS